MSTEELLPLHIQSTYAGLALGAVLNLVLFGTIFLGAFMGWW